MNNVKTYRDGDRFILVVENCNGSLATKVNEFIVSIMGIEEEPIEVSLSVVVAVILIIVIVLYLKHKKGK